MTQTMIGIYLMDESNPYYKKYLSLQGRPNRRLDFRQFVNYEKELVKIHGDSILEIGA